VHTPTFFKLFPPPKFLVTSHVGLDISDDAIRFIQYSKHKGSLVIGKYGQIGLPVGLIEGGDIKDEKKLGEIISTMSREHKMSYARISIPEEKAYLFETDVFSLDEKDIRQNIESKLEENVPLTAPDAMFAFYMLPMETGKPRRASVSVVPKSYIEKMIELFHSAGIIPIAFETVPRAIARVVSDDASGSIIVIHVMDRKIGISVISENVIGFTSTVLATADGSDMASYSAILAAEVRRVYAYWLSRDNSAKALITSIIIVGSGAESTALALREKVSDILPITVADVWHNIFDVDRYVPPIAREDSLEYAAAAGLAL
jgi:hypothetical protein